MMPLEARPPTARAQACGYGMAMGMSYLRRMTKRMKLTFLQDKVMIGMPTWMSISIWLMKIPVNPMYRIHTMRFTPMSPRRRTCSSQWITASTATQRSLSPNHLDSVVVVDRFICPPVDTDFCPGSTVEHNVPRADEKRGSQGKLGTSARVDDGRIRAPELIESKRARCGHGVSTK
nr:uncharacterized protein LOC117846989 [Setaria viridis]